MAEGRTRALVIGQGALGTLVAATLAAQGVAVTVRSARAAKAATVELRASARRDLMGTVTITPDLPDEPVEVVFLASRADAVLGDAVAGSRALDAGGIMVPLQNGLVPLDVLEAHGREVVVPCVVGLNAHLTDERTAAVTSPGGFVFASEVEQAREAAEPWAHRLSAAATTRVLDNPRGAVWSKWCVSCAINGLAVVHGTGIEAVASTREGRLALLGILTECVRLAEHGHVRLERVAGPLTPDRLAGPAEHGAGARIRHALVRGLARRYRGVEPSSLASLRAGRDLELDVLNERAVQLGKQHGVGTPWNEAVATVARAIESGDIEPGEQALAQVVEQARG